MKNLVTNSFKRFAVQKLITKALFIYKQMTENADIFPSPEPSLAELKQLAVELAADNLAAASADRIKLAFLKSKKMEVVSFLQDLGVYVNLKSRGRRDIALCSGFDLVKIKESRVLVAPLAPHVKRKQTPGNLEAKIKAQVAAIRYTWYITDDSNKPLREWDQLKNESSRVLFTGKKPGTQYYICVEMQGARKQLKLSPIAIMIA